MAAHVTLHDDIIDSRDIESRIDELEALKEAVDDAKEAVDERRAELVEEFGGEEETDLRPREWADFCDADEELKGLVEAHARADQELIDEMDSDEELDQLLEVRTEVDGYSREWRHGVTLINDDYFERYAEQLADDLGLISNTAQWPATCIDWKQAAKELQSDYTSVEIGSETYWYR
jgi:hypothetical protein